MEVPEGAEDTPGRPQGVVEGGDIDLVCVQRSLSLTLLLVPSWGCLLAPFQLVKLLTNLHQEPWMGHKDLGQGLWSRQEQGLSVSIMDFRTSTSAYVFLYLVQILRDNYPRVPCECKFNSQGLDYGAHILFSLDFFLLLCYQCCNIFWGIFSVWVIGYNFA